jgi:nucleotide-binding universal stress UspA family protein
MKKILLALDGSDESLHALDTAIELSLAFSSELFLLCVATLESLPESLRGVAELKLSELSAADPRWPGMANVPLWLHEAVDVIKNQGTHQRVIDELAVQILEKAYVRANAAGVKSVKMETGSGDPAREIVSRSRSLNSDLVIVAPWHDEAGRSQGGVAGAVARDCSCNCLIARPSSAQPRQDRLTV